MNGSRDDTSISVILCTSSHGECFACAGLAVAENGARVSFESGLDDVLADDVEDDFLRCVLKNFFKSEIPVFLLMVDMSVGLVFWDVDVHVSGRLVDLEVFRGEVDCWP